MASSRRFVDYFVVAGYDHKRGQNPALGSGGFDAMGSGQTAFQCQGTVLQRFPIKDWSDTPFTEGLEHFCQPNGWFLYTERSDPKFFIAGLTDINGSRQYCAVLSFSEPIDKEDLQVIENQQKSPDDDEENLMSIAATSLMVSRGTTSLPRHTGVSLPAHGHEGVLFAPKCLVLVSKHDYPEVFRNCLGVIYTAYSECLVGAAGERIRLEPLIGNLLGSVYISYSNGPQIRFSLGANDKMVLQPPLFQSVPVTGTKVSLLFKLLGIRNVLDLFCAALTEHKILFYSQSFMRLSEACTALIALMYPLKYSHVFIPILPSSLLEVLATPTPFIIGVNAIHETEISELLDVIKVDLDGGAITIPENMIIHQVPQLRRKAHRELTMVLQPELSVADNAFLKSDNSQNGKRPLALLDKELRAVMLRHMVQLLEGYRSCLTLVRIHPRPFIAFHKAAFLGLRNLCDSEFMRRFIHSMYLGTFINERGVPWRKCDIFDDLCSSFGDQSLLEEDDPSKIYFHVKILAEELYRNENPMTTNNQPYAQKIPQPAEGAMSRIHQPIFPILDENLVTEVIRSGLQRMEIERASQSGNQGVLILEKLVPEPKRYSFDLFEASKSKSLMPLSVRKLGVLRNCLASIFDGKIADAKKTFPAVVSALKSKQVRLAFCEELAVRMGDKKRIILSNQQFDMIVRLMNAALQDDSDLDEYGIASAMLPLSTLIGRELRQGVTQFAYTLIQDHAVWHNQQFWEASFFSDVQKGIRALYKGLRDLNSNPARAIDYESANHVSSSKKYPEVPMQEQTILELAAEEIRGWQDLDESKQRERIKAEEKTVYSQAFAYVTNMMYFLCPLDIAMQKKNGKRIRDEFDNTASNSISNSVAESDSIDAESGFEDQEIPDSGQQVIKSVLRFADKVCAESDLPEEYIRNISSMIPTTVALHLEELEAVAKQVARLPPIEKRKISSPSLLPGEKNIGKEDGLRVYLLPDGRDDPFGGARHNLLPAEGKLFLTNYRIIFKGKPIDPFAAEHSVIRYFPVTSLTREKKISINEYLNEIEQHLKEGIQLRSNTFQLIRAAFDNEVTVEDVETFRKNLHLVQYPEHIFHFFAFRGIHYFADQNLLKDKEKNQKYATIRGIANKTLKNVTKVTGYQAKKRKGAKHLLPTMLSSTGRLTYQEGGQYETSVGGRIREEDELSEISSDSQVQQKFPSSSSGSKSLERLTERSYFKDWVRLGLIPNDYNIYVKGSSHHFNESFRVTTINSRYSVIPSYPAILLLPGRITDDSLKAYTRCHKQSRFPAITWRHPHNQSLLLRGAGFHGRGMFDMIRRHQDPHSASSTQVEMTTSSIDAKHYTEAIIRITPRSLLRPEAAWSMSGSELSINSLVVPTISGSSGARTSNTLSDVHSYPTMTPNMARKMNPISKAMDTLTRGTNPPKLGRLSLSSMKGNKAMGSQGSLASSSSSAAVSYSRGSYRLSSDTDHGSSKSGLQNFLQRTSLFIFGDKHQMKGLKLESHPKTEFIPVDHPEPRKIRASFKKLMRACAPSSKISEQSELTFLKQVENSEWLHMLQNIMNISGAVIDLMDIQGASVNLCLEDGWDVTCQISSIVQLCCDPYYRTLEGFRVLIEKEWIAFGHRFHHRSNLSNFNQDSGFTPIFLQFLDIVHQILAQFPTSFEFNQFYLRFLAYHHTSCRFRTFLLENEQQRNEIGFLAQENKLGSMPKSLKNTYEGSSGAGGYASSEDESGNQQSGNIKGGNIGVNIFDYIDYHAAQSTIFHNFLYAPELDDQVIRPNTSVPNLRIWDYFISEELRHGAPYEFEVYEMDMREKDNSQANDSLTSNFGRDSFTFGYSCLERTLLHSCSNLLSEISQLEAELGHSPKHWLTHWLRFDANINFSSGNPRSLAPVAMIEPQQYMRLQNRIQHKNSTLELILKGSAHASSAIAVADQSGLSARNPRFSRSHRFEKYNYSTPTSCDVCGNLLWSPVRTGLKCTDCSFNCHEKCKENVIKVCSKFKSVSSTNAASLNTTDHLENVSPGYHKYEVDSEHPGLHLPTSSGMANAISDDDDLFHPFAQPSLADENSQIICQGYLYKQANFRIKGWKQRWFVLDATKHQLRYYDSREDFQCRGHIDLSEVTRIVEGSIPVPAPKKAEEGCCFDLQTQKRTYSFCAENRPAAMEWVQKIQSCLSS